jgi:glycosyltransferase involved in cell wall biosynthesis
MISFIVPAHDEERLIGETLEALVATTARLSTASEIIVVADASTDATAEIARGSGALVIEVDHRHIAATRNAGAKIARGHLLIFVDADTLVDATLIEAAQRAIDAGAIGGGCAVRLQEPLSRSERVAQGFFCWLFRVTRIAPGCFVFVTRAAFDTVGGFDETWYAGEDVAISRALAKHGRFVILRESVFTSARKLRTHSFAEHARMLLRFTFRGRRLLKSRDQLDLWYGRRR